MIRFYLKSLITKIKQKVNKFTGEQKWLESNFSNFLHLWLKHYCFLTLDQTFVPFHNFKFVKEQVKDILEGIHQTQNSIKCLKPHNTD